MKIESAGVYVPDGIKAGDFAHFALDNLDFEASLNTHGLGLKLHNVARHFRRGGGLKEGSGELQQYPRISREFRALNE
jgi:hypothetical protein